MFTFGGQDRESNQLNGSGMAIDYLNFQSLRLDRLVGRSHRQAVTFRDQAIAS